jgi:hypothetical protein
LGDDEVNPQSLNGFIHKQINPSVRRAWAGLFYACIELGKKVKPFGNNA